MTAIDLFCGRGGWTNGLLAAGFKVYGFDINPQPEYKGILIHADILEITTDILRKFAPDFAVCSSPCEQFSVHCMKHFHPNPPYPEMGIKLFNHARMLLEELGIPYVMENVRCAEKFVGKAVNHCGPFYLWGTGVPAVMPKQAYEAKKGTKFGLDPWHFGVDGETMRNNSKETVYRMRRENRKKFDMYYRTGSKSKARRDFKAEVATIPLSVAQAVADGARQLVKLRAEV